VGEQLLQYLAPRSGDRITKHWPLTSHSAVLYMISGYLVGVAILSLIMSFVKKPINIKFLQQIYNPMQIILCSWIGLQITYVAYSHGARFCLNDHIYTRDDYAIIFWFFYVSKFFDFFDTLFIILGKKWHQLTFLHLYHHSSICFVVWIGINAGFDGDAFLTVTLNTAVHVIMYFYYLLTSVGIQVWWKKLLTYVQIIQFIIMISQSLVTLALLEDHSPERAFFTSVGSYLPKDVSKFIGNLFGAYEIILDKPMKYPLRVTRFYTLYICSMLVLFIHFAVQTYCTRKDDREKEKEKEKGGSNGQKGKQKNE